MARLAKAPTLALLHLAAEQRGLVTWARVLRAEMSRHAALRLIDDGWLRRVRLGVYAVGGHQASPWDSAVAALLVTSAMDDETILRSVSRILPLGGPVVQSPDGSLVDPRRGVRA